MLALELRSWGDWIVAVLAWWVYGSVMFLAGAAWVAGAAHRRDMHRLERAADRARDPHHWPNKEPDDANAHKDLGV